MEVTNGRGYVYSIQYHVVWCVKYRHNLWNPSYFVATVSENTEEQIRKYIQNQKVKWGDDYDRESIQVSYIPKQTAENSDS